MLYVEHTAARKSTEGFITTLVDLTENRSNSIYATYKLSMTVDSQTRATSHNYVSVVGIHGAPLAFIAARGESVATMRCAVEAAVPPDARGQVENVTSDV